MELSPEQKRIYATMIDDILSESDLSLVTEKKIRNALQERLGHDISGQKAALKEVIMERFNAMVPPTTTTPPSDDAAIKDERTVKKTNTNGVKKVKSEESQDSSDDLSEVEAKPAKKKQRKSQDSDAKLAAMLQAQENSRARPSRAGTTKKVPVKRKPKKKSAAKIKGDDDSDVGLNSDGEKKVVNRTGGFHKEYNLSETLAQLVGETKLSRPQAVKKIWEHIKANDLQDPADKRQLICDEKMQAVFKADRVHMFTMNKLLGKHLYPIEEV